MNIGFIQSWPHSFAYGGQEYQTQCLIDAINLNSGYTAKLVDWNKTIEDFDIYHIVGNSWHMSEVLRFIPASAPYVVSAIHGVRQDSFAKRAVKIGFSKLGKLLGEKTHYDALRKIFNEAAHVTALTSTSAKFLISRYKISSDNTSVIMNGVSDQLLSLGNKLRLNENRNDILILGSICHRKSSKEIVEFSKSREGQSYVFHFVGKGLPNEDQYFNDFKAEVEISSNIIYHGHVEKMNPSFIRIVKQCGILLMPSKEETQSLAALECIALGLSCVFLDRNYAKENPFNVYPRVSNLQNNFEIDSAIRKAKSLIHVNREIPSWNDIATQYIEIYEAQIRSFSH